MSSVHASTHPLVLHKLTVLRDKNTDPRKFRELVREISALLTYEATQDLVTQPKEVVTPMGKAKGFTTKENIGLVPILRAGLGMVDGVWDLLPDAEVWHIGPLPRREDFTARGVLQQAAHPADGWGLPGARSHAGYRRLGSRDCDDPEKVGSEEYQIRWHHRRT